MLFFIEKGYMMEYIMMEPNHKKIVTLFFGPGEFAIKCHPVYSSLASLDGNAGNPFTYSDIFCMLRCFPETHFHYQAVRSKYQEKVVQRLRLMQMLPGPERLEHLQADQPWVFELVNPADIASYTGVSEVLIKEWKR